MGDLGAAAPMVIALIFSLAGVVLVAAAVLNGIEPLVAFGAEWGRIAVAAIGTVFLFLGVRVAVRIARGDHRKFLKMAPELREAQLVHRAPRARATAALVVITGLGLAALGIHDGISGGAIQLTDVGSTAFTALGVASTALGLFLGADPRRMVGQLRAAQERAAAAAMPAQRHPCSACGSANLCFGVRLRGGDGTGVYAATTATKRRRWSATCAATAGPCVSGSALRTARGPS